MSAPHLGSLTGLRFPAALFVFAFHAAIHSSPGSVHDAAVAVAGRGYVGVSFFFVLSGFVLTWSHREGTTPGDFYRRRFARIAPVYWLCLGAAALLLLLSRGQPVDTVLRALPSVVGLQAWFPQQHIHFAPNGPGWSISAEMFFYLLFPLLVLASRHRHGRVLMGVGVVVLAAVPALLLRPVDPDLSSAAAWAIYVLPLTRLADFVVGILLARAVLGGWRPPLRLGAALALTAVAYVATGFVPPWATVNLVTLVPFALLIAAAADADLQGRASWWRTTTAQRLGAWSFAFYLIQALVLRVQGEAAARLGLSVGQEWLTILAALGATLLAAAVVHERFEVPLERRLRPAAPRPAATSSGSVPPP